MGTLYAALLLAAVTSATAATPAGFGDGLEPPQAAALAPAFLPRSTSRMLLTSDTSAFGPGYAEGATPGPFLVRLDRRRASTLELLGQVRGLRRGVGFDYALSDAGRVHLNLYSGREGFGGGRRWDLGGLAEPERPSSRLWSVGASLDLVRFRRDADDPGPNARVVLAPQIMLDLDALTGLPGRCDLMVQQTLWRGADERATDDGRVTQVVVKWKL
jgi:hypothetical protein